MVTKSQCARKFKQAVHIGKLPSKKRLGKDIVCKTQNAKVLSHKGKVTYQLHRCPIVKVDRKKKIATLNSCGYETKTTKDHMNLALSELGIGKPVSQKKYIWYVNGKKFKDGMKVKFY